MALKQARQIALGTLALGILLAAAAAAQQPAIPVTQLKAGQKAPDFTLLDNHFQPVKLSQFRGKSSVVLAIYVLAFTSG